MAWKGTTLHGKETSMDINETLRTVDINSIRLKCKFAHGIQMNFWIVAVSLKYIYWFKSLKYLIFFVRNYNSWTILPPIEMFNNLVDSVGFGKAGNGSRGCGIYRRQRWQFIEAFECQWRQRTRKTRREGKPIRSHSDTHFTSLHFTVLSLECFVLFKFRYVQSHSLFCSFQIWSIFHRKTTF